MRKLLIMAAALSISAPIFAQIVEKAKVTAIISKEKVKELKGNYIYLSELKKDGDNNVFVKLDSVKIAKNNKLTFKAREPKVNALNKMYIEFDKERYQVVLEPGEVLIDISDPDNYATKKGKLNIEIEKYSKESGYIVIEARKVIAEINQSEADAETKANKIQEAIRPFEEKLFSLSRSYFDKNKNNYLGLMAIKSMLKDDSMTIEKQRALISEAGETVRNSDDIKKILATLDAQDRTAPGKKFVDFEATKNQTEKANFSDYVGKGKYTIVDFWASWCGPCRREVPNLIKIYEKYKDKGVEMLGVAVWDKMEDHISAVEKLGINYPQIFNQKEATEIYGILGIPQIMLIAPDGTIVARDLRGAAIEELLEKELSKK